jgi:hypothetical protein
MAAFELDFCYDCWESVGMSTTSVVENLKFLFIRFYSVGFALSRCCPVFVS